MCSLARVTISVSLLVASTVFAAPVEQVRVVEYELTDNGDDDGFADSNETPPPNLADEAATEKSADG